MCCVLIINPPISLHTYEFVMYLAWYWLGMGEGGSSRSHACSQPCSQPCSQAAAVAEPYTGGVYISATAEGVIWLQLYLCIGCKLIKGEPTAALLAWLLAPWLLPSHTCHHSANGHVVRMPQA